MQRRRKEIMTNESLSREFSDSFDLANRAIRYAQGEIQAEREIHISTLLDRLRKNPRNLLGEE